MIKQINPFLEGAPTFQKLVRGTDGTKFFTPSQVARRWGWHPESVRRGCRENRIAAIVISRRLLIAVSEVERIEAEGRLSPTA